MRFRNQVGVEIHEAEDKKERRGKGYENPVIIIL